jgi:hypothetical protein
VVSNSPRVLCVDKLGNRQAFVLAVALRRAISKEEDLPPVEVDWAGVSEEECPRTVSDLILGSLTTLGFGVELSRIGGKFEGYSLSKTIKPGLYNLVICLEDFHAGQIREMAGKKTAIISMNHPALEMPEKPSAEEYLYHTKGIVKEIVPPVMAQLRDMLVSA